eukprot:GHUV01007132.1.p1 GENE.GHUV01007132.1~~GHUV01007132.1.p1  ORF type:complete len:889 (+),score=286.27 GHUV01007132.1:1018-3684(+)
MQNIDPNLLLLIFLPTIGFSAALGQEPHLLRKNWGQILILAWPGVVITFLLIAICAKYFFPYSWSWPQALLFGAMLSATDPVAVVAILHEVGADEKLANVIDGESLVNDGSALVIFLVLQRFVQGESLTASQIVALFIRLALLGAAVGAAFAMVTSVWLSRIFNDPGLEIVLTFGAAYSCYFVAEELLGASGLLAVVVMGFSMSIVGGRQVTTRIKVEMGAFWEALEWIANTILFIWVGIALGLVLPPDPTHPALQYGVQFSYHLAAADAGYAVVLYLWLMVARSATIAAFYPLLSTGRVGYAMNWKTAVVMVWAGLRGAVGVAMSLFILVDTKISSDEYKAHCVFYMAVMAFATVLINGSTAKYLLRGLGLLKMTPQQIQVLEHVLQEVDAIREINLANLKPSAVMGKPDPNIVSAWTSLDTHSMLHNVHKRFQRSHATAESGPRSKDPAAVATREAAASAVGGHGRLQLLAEYRARLLRVVKATYGDLYQHFELGTSEIGILQEATDAALDAVTNPTVSHATAAAAADPELGQHGSNTLTGRLTDWEKLRAQLDNPGCVRSWDMMCCCCLPQQCLRQPLQEQSAAVKLAILSAFVKAHTTAQQLVREHMSELHGQGQHTETPHQVTTHAGGHNNSTGFHDGHNQRLHDQSIQNHRPAATAATTEAQLEAAQQPSTAGQQLLGAADGDGAGGNPDDDLEVLQIVSHESQEEVAAALAYAQQVVLPDHPQLAALLMSRYVSIHVLEEQLEFLEGIEAAGLIKGEEISTIQQQLNHRLEILQHERHWHLPPAGTPIQRGWHSFKGIPINNNGGATIPHKDLAEASTGAVELGVRQNQQPSAAFGAGIRGQGTVESARKPEGIVRAERLDRGFNYLATLSRRHSSLQPVT